MWSLGTAEPVVRGRHSTVIQLSGGTPQPEGGTTSDAKLLLEKESCVTVERRTLTARL